MSKALRRAAEGGALGGAGNVLEELKDLKDMFGELDGGGNGGEWRVGFGVEDEVISIEKGASYGRVSDSLEALLVDGMMSPEFQNIGNSDNSNLM